MSKDHARFSPSSLDNLKNCIRFKWDDAQTTDEATEGTLLHEAAEHEDTAGLSDNQAEDVTRALEYVNNLKAATPGDWLDIKEERVTLKDLTYGHPDRVLFNKNTGGLHVIDYKFTRVAGDHEFQARTYAACFIEMHPELDIKTCTTHIVAPRLNIIEQTPHDPATLVDDVRLEIMKLYAKIDNPFNPPTPGDQCGRCKWAGECPALNQTAVTLSKGLGLPVPEAFDPGAMVSVDDRAIAQTVAGAIINWADKVKKANTEFVKNGGEIPGYTLRSRSTGARIDKESTALAKQMLQAAGFNEDHILQACRLSLPDLAKIHAQTSSDSERASREKVKTVLSALTREGQSTFLQKSKRVSDEALIKQLTTGEKE